MRRTREYRVVTETPQGCRWHCAWCHADAVALTPTWQAALTALLDVHSGD